MEKQKSEVSLKDAKKGSDNHFVFWEDLALWEVYWSLMGQEAIVMIQTGNGEDLNEVRSQGTGGDGE